MQVLEKHKPNFFHGDRTLIFLLRVVCLFCSLILLIFLRSVSILFVTTETRNSKSFPGSPGTEIEKNPCSEFVTTSMLNEML